MRSLCSEFLRYREYVLRLSLFFVFFFCSFGLVLQPIKSHPGRVAPTNMASPILGVMERINRPTRSATQYSTPSSICSAVDFRSRQLRKVSFESATDLECKQRTGVFANQPTQESAFPSSRTVSTLVITTSERTTTIQRLFPFSALGSQSAASLEKKGRGKSLKIHARQRER